MIYLQYTSPNTWYMWGPVVQWLVQRFRSERLRVRSRRSATFTPSAHVRRQSLPVWPPTLNNYLYNYLYLYMTDDIHDLSAVYISQNRVSIRVRTCLVKVAPSFLPDHTDLSWNHTVATSRVGVPFSLEPGPSRAWYFPRDMLLLTTTAQERAWRLLKITSQLLDYM